MKIRISNKWIGDNYPAFIVAEAGINHNGNVKIAKSLIVKAKEIGADAIKFQTFKASDFTTPKSKYFKIFKKYELEYNDFSELVDYAKSNKIIFFSTPSSEEAVDVLSDLHVPAFKIASGDLTNIPLIQYTATKKKPMIISTGLANMKEIQTAVDSVKSTGNNKIVIMHSVSTYPTPYQETNLNSIKQIQKKFQFPVGYSDNGSDLLVPVISVALGAKMVEKHFTLNRKMQGSDHFLSADPQQFKALIKNVRRVEDMLGDGIKRCQPSELKNRIHIRKSITANITIKKNTKITREMIGVKRPAFGIEPIYLSKVIGRKAAKQITKNQALRWEDIK